MSQAALAPDASRERLKAAALALFSAHGVDGVSVRDIVAAAGMRNGASLHYHFGSKEALIRELVQDGARASDAARVRRLAALEAAGGPRLPADIVRLLVEVETAPDAAGAPVGFGHMRFVMALQINHRRLFQSALEGERTPGYLRCLQHLRRLIPDLPEPLLRQRLVFLYLHVVATLAAREAAFEGGAAGGPLWGSAQALPNLVDALTGMLTAPAASALDDQRVEAEAGGR